MNKFVILTDGACDLSEDLRTRFGIDDYLPGVIIYPDGHSELSDLDWKKMSAYEYYSSMSKNCFYKTAQRSLTSTVSFFEKYLAEGLDILNISISSALSGAYGTCCVAAKELTEKYPERKIFCIDSKRYCGALALLCCAAGEMRAAGKSLEEVVAWIEGNKELVHEMGTVDDLMFLRKMGRVSNVSALMGTLVGVKPLADFNSAGMSHVIGKTTGYRNMYDATIEYMRRTITEPENQIIFVSYSNRKAQAVKLKEMIEAEFSPREVILTIVSKSCGAAIGPGMAAAFYIGKPFSPELTEEINIITEITK